MRFYQTDYGELNWKQEKTLEVVMC